MLIKIEVVDKTGDNENSLRVAKIKFPVPEKLEFTIQYFYTNTTDMFLKSSSAEQQLRCKKVQHFPPKLQGKSQNANKVQYLNKCTLLLPISATSPDQGIESFLCPL